MRTLFTGLALGASFLISSNAAAVSVGSSTGGGVTTQHEYQTDYAAWFVADLVTDPVVPAPIPVTASLTAGRWTQVLSFAAGSPNLQTGEIFVLQELLTIGSGDFPLQNWRQEILSPSWKWDDGSIFDNNTAEPLPGLVVNRTDSVISFSFNAVTPGANLFVVKALQYIGPDGAAPAPFSVQAYAVVPEPSRLAVLPAMLVSLAVCRRRVQVTRVKHL